MMSAFSTFTVRDIQAAVADQAAISLETLLGPSQKRQFTFPRQRAMWAVRRLKPRMSLPQMGERFGGRDHTTVLHGVRAVDERILSDPFEAAACDALLAMFAQPDKTAQLDRFDADLVAAALAGRDAAGCAANAGVAYAVALPRLNVLAASLARAADRVLVSEEVVTRKPEGLTFIAPVLLPTPEPPTAPAPTLEKQRAAPAHVVRKPRAKPVLALPAPAAAPEPTSIDAEFEPVGTAEASPSLPALRVPSHLQTEDVLQMSRDDERALMGLGAPTRGGCNWPVGEPGTEGFALCGEPRDGSRPYCPEHSRRAFVPPPKPRSHKGDRATQAARRFS